MARRSQAGVRGVRGMRLTGSGRRPAAPPGVSRVLVVLLCAATVAGVGWALRWNDDERPRARHDTLQYARLAYGYSGLDHADAYIAAHDLRCRYWRTFYTPPGPLPESTVLPSTRTYRLDCVDRDPERLQETREARYEALFDSRVLYPLLVAALIPVLDHDAFAAVTLLAGIAAGVCLAGAVLASGGRATSALLSVVMLYALPSGEWLAVLHPEGLVAAGLALALVGVALVVVRERLLLGAVVLVLGLVTTFLTKSANGVLAAGALAAAGVTLALVTRQRGRPRAAVVVAVTSTGAGAAFVLASRAAGWAGAQETLQDFYTWHFSSPDVPGPLLPRLWGTNRRFWEHLLEETLAGEPFVLVAVLAGGAAIAVRWRRGCLPWLAVGLTGPAVVAAHPVSTELPRLLLPLWLTTAVGLALLLDAGLRAAPADVARGVPAGAPPS